MPQVYAPRRTVEKKFVLVALFLAAFTLLFVGCPMPGGGGGGSTNYPAVTSPDVGVAGAAFNRALSSLSISSLPGSAVTVNGNNATINYHSGDGKLSIAGTVAGWNTLTETIHEVATLTNLVDSATGYTISGTITVDMIMTFALSGVLTQISMSDVADLNFSGTGPVRKLTVTISVTQPYISGVPSTPSTTGTVTCNGQTFGPYDLGSGSGGGPQAATPTFSPSAGTYEVAQNVTIGTTTAGAAIRYTTDGITTPTATVGTLYTSPISVTNSQTLMAIAYQTGYTDSAVGTSQYTIGVAVPTFSPGAGTYDAPQSVIISTATAGATIRYTTDGVTTPTETVGTVYAGPISVTANQTLKAIAYKSGLPRSAQNSGAYAITYWTTFGSQGSGINQFYQPCGVVADADGHVYIADGNGRIVRIDDMTGSGWTTFGSDGSGAGQFHEPYGIALDASKGILVAEEGNYRITRINDISGTGWITLGASGSGDKQFNCPAGVTVDASGHIYIADYNNHRIVRVDDMTGAGWTAVATASAPYGVALDSAGRIYVGEDFQIERLDDMSGAGRLSFGTHGSGMNQFGRASTICIDPAGRIYIADGWTNGRIVRIDDMTGKGWTTFGSYGTGQ